jgi:hypothetical protein
MLVSKFYEQLLIEIITNDFILYQNSDDTNVGFLYNFIMYFNVKLLL